MITEDTPPPPTRPDTLRDPAIGPPAGPGGGVERAAAALKPRMRGWLHTGMSPLALVGGIVLVALSRSAAEVAACSVFALSALLLFGTSGIYHRGNWSTGCGTRAR